MESPKYRGRLALDDRQLVHSVIAGCHLHRPGQNQPKCLKLPGGPNQMAYSTERPPDVAQEHSKCLNLAPTRCDRRDRGTERGSKVIWASRCRISPNQSSTRVTQRLAHRTASENEAGDAWRIQIRRDRADLGIL